MLYQRQAAMCYMMKKIITMNKRRSKPTPILRTSLRYLTSLFRSLSILSILVNLAIWTSLYNFPIRANRANRLNSPCRKIKSKGIIDTASKKNQVFTYCFAINYNVQWFSSLLYSHRPSYIDHCSMEREIELWRRWKSRYSPESPRSPNSRIRHHPVGRPVSKVSADRSKKAFYIAGHKSTLTE